MLRALHAYRTAQERVKDQGGELSRHGAHLGADLPSFEELRIRYEDLMAEWAEERPVSPHGVLSYVELVSEIIAGELASRFREEGGIVQSELDLNYALELLVGVRKWVNALDLQDALGQERGFRVDRATPAASMREGEGWPVLHRRWSDLVDKINALDAKAGATKNAREAARLTAERDLLVNHDVDDVLKEIFDRPADNWEAAATLVDVALENDGIELPEDLVDCVAFNKVLKALRDQAPAIEFTSLRRLYGPSVDVEAIIAKA